MTQGDALQILKSGENVFLTGEPGAGKTYTVNEFIEWLSSHGRDYAVTASTGIAATHVRGMTIHSWAGIGIKRNLNDAMAQYIASNPYLGEKIRNNDVLIIDEISMLDAQFIDDIDFLFRVMRGGSRPFGGMQVVFVGDFFQLPPVSKDRAMHFAFEAKAWEQAKLVTCYLTEQHRQSDATFLEVLSAMRNGTIEERHKEILRACATPHPQGFSTMLFTHNVDVDTMNLAELFKVQGEQREFKMTSEGIPWMQEVLKKSVLSPEVLKLKIGAEVMFTKNNREAGYMNGTMGQVVGWDEYDGYPIVETDDGTFHMDFDEWQIEDNGMIKARVRQIPLRLAYAITVHKSQGISLDAATIDLSKTFEYGQGYVAISRVRSLGGLHLKGLNAKAFEMHPRVIGQDKIFRMI